MVEANGANLVFLLSTPRAGSTLLSTVLGNHSEVFCPNEPWLLLALSGLTQEKPPTPVSTNAELAAIALGQLLSREEFIGASQAFALSVYNSKLRSSGKPIFVDKTPRYALVLPFLDEMFPQAKKIWLQRNPLDVAASYASTWNIPVAELIGETLTVNSFDVTVGLHNLLNYFQGQANTLEVRYEDLVAEPSRVIAALCAFLKITPEPDLERYAPNQGILSDMKEQLMGDKNIFAHSRPHPGSVNRWKDALSRPDLQKLIDHLGREPFERMGYHETVRELEKLGSRFPSQGEVESRLQGLRERATNYMRKPKKPGSKASVGAWWLKVGRTLGRLRPSTVQRN